MTNSDLDENEEVHFIQMTTETMVHQYSNKRLICEYIKWKKAESTADIPKEKLKWVDAQDAYEWIDILNGVCKDILDEYNITYENKPNTMETIYTLVDSINRSNSIPFKLSWKLLLNPDSME